MGLCTSLRTRMSKLVRSADSLGSNYELNCQGDSSFKTIFGGILTLACLTITLTYLYRQLVGLVEQTNLKVTDVVDYPQAELKIDFIGHGLMPVIIMLNSTSNMALPSMLQSNVATFVGELETSFIDLTQNRLVQNSTQFQFKPCRNLVNRKPYKDFYENNQFRAQMDAVASCVELPENLTINLFGGLFDIASTRFRVVAYPCSSGTCVPSNQLSQYTFATGSSKKFIKYTDYKNPIRQTLIPQNNLNILGTELGFQLTTSLSISQMQDQTFLLSDPGNLRTIATVHEQSQTIKPRQYPQTTCTQTQIADRSCAEYFSLAFVSSGISHDVLRSYPDFLQVLSDVGGFKEIIFVSVGVLYCFYNELMKKKYLGLKLVSMRELLIFFENPILSAQKVHPGSFNDIGKTKLDYLKPHAISETEPINGLQQNIKQKRIERPSTSSKVPAVETLTESQHIREHEPRPHISAHPDFHSKQKSTDAPAQKKYTRSLSKLRGFEDAHLKEDLEIKDLLNKNWTFKEFKKFIGLRNEVLSLIEMYSDITHISKELISFGVLKEVLFTPYQLKLLPLVSIELQRKRQQKERVQSEGIGSSNALVQNVCSFISDSLRYKDALESLADSVDQSLVMSPSERHAPPLRSDPLGSLRHDIDKFIYENLPDFVSVHLTKLADTEPHDTKQHPPGIKVSDLNLEGQEPPPEYQKSSPQELKITPKFPAVSAEPLIAPKIPAPHLAPDGRRGSRPQPHKPKLYYKVAVVSSSRRNSLSDSANAARPV